MINNPGMHTKMFNEYYVYHLKGLKVGCTNSLENRVENTQGFKKNEYEVLHTVNNIFIASFLEIQEQKERGYSVESEPYYKIFNNKKLMRTLSTPLTTGFYCETLEELPALINGSVTLKTPNYGDLVFDTPKKIEWILDNIKVSFKRKLNPGIAPFYVQNKTAYEFLKTVTIVTTPERDWKDSGDLFFEHTQIHGMYFAVVPNVCENGYYGITLENGELYSYESVKQLKEFIDKHELREWDLSNDNDDWSFTKIRLWAKDKGLYGHSNSSIQGQTMKLMEETGELAKGVLKDQPKEIKDGIGDVIVVLTSIAELAGFSIEECIQHAWLEIKDRQGNTNDKGDFIKNTKNNEK